MRRARRIPWRRATGPVAVAALGAVILVVTFALDSRAARSSADQVWSPFVLVTGLLLIGLVANDDGVFEWLGATLTRISSRGTVVFAGAATMIVAVTAVLNLDTAVAFLTPVLIHTSRRRGGDDAPWLYGVLLLANAGSLWLPGSNLTNLIVLGHLHLTGAAFAARMWAPALGASLITALVVAVFGRDALVTSEVRDRVSAPSVGVGAFAVLAAVLAVVLLSNAAVPVALIGLLAVGWHLAHRRVEFHEVMAVVGPGALIGLFAIATALGTLGRAWSFPSQALHHANTTVTALTASVASVLVNNLPAASIFAARVPSHPFALLIGLNLGPNLAATGSLAWLLWWRSARGAGATPSLARASRWGAVVTPLSLIASLALLALSGRS